MEEVKIKTLEELINYLKTRIEDAQKTYDELVAPYKTEYGIVISYMKKKEKEEFINKRNCLLIQKYSYEEILNKIQF